MLGFHHNLKQNNTSHRGRKGAKPVLWGSALHGKRTWTDRSTQKRNLESSRKSKVKSVQEQAGGFLWDTLLWSCSKTIIFRITCASNHRFPQWKLASQGTKVERPKRFPLPLRAPHMNSLDAQNTYTLKLALHAICRQFIRQEDISPPLSNHAMTMQNFESTRCVFSSCPYIPQALSPLRLQKRVQSVHFHKRSCMKDHPRQEPSQRRDFNRNDKATQQVLRVLDSAWLLDPINPLWNPDFHVKEISWNFATEIHQSWWALFLPCLPSTHIQMRPIVSMSFLALWFLNCFWSRLWPFIGTMLWPPRVSSPEPQ